jgi:hypothetical protein
MRDVRLKIEMTEKLAEAARSKFRKDGTLRL